MHITQYYTKNMAVGDYGMTCEFIFGRNVNTLSTVFSSDGDYAEFRITTADAGLLLAVSSFKTSEHSTSACYRNPIETQ
jgi:hypothetical protein